MCTPKESSLKYLDRDPGGASMSSSRRIMAMGDNTLFFIIKIITSTYSIIEVLEKKRFLPKVGLDVIEQFLLRVIS